jgi:RNA polymerase sigma-70 factor (ECF subfamily)
MARGDEQAFELLFQTWYGPLVVFAYRWLHDKMEAENIVQGVFIKLWEKRKIQRIKEVGSYLMVAVRNRCMNQLNRQKHHLSLDERWSLPDSSKEEELPDPELLEKVYQAIDRMPPQRQKIFRLGRLEGLKYKEIAALLNISPKTVEAQMSKGLRYLRELFAGPPCKKETSG